ncbi:MAG TPA: hypothetical protein VFM18_16580 [Methanosarcina sp.]|nr:hypothetical protein [Methanosarcina sp.]
MSYTELADIFNWLKELEETTLMELLDVNSTDIVEAFSDRIVENQDKFIKAYVEDKQNNLS